MTHPREELLAAFRMSDRTCENRDHICSCLECVAARQTAKQPIVFFTEEDIAWNRKLGAVHHLQPWTIAAFLVICWAWVCFFWKTGEIVLWLWAETTR